MSNIGPGAGRLMAPTVGCAQGAFQGPGQRILSRVDSNGDGVIDRQEVLDRRGELFDRVDDNRDGGAALDAVAEPEDPAPTQEKRLDERRSKERVMQAVAALPEGQSIAMTLIYEGGLSNAEAASTMGISVRARRKLRKMMAR